ncbi:MAG TPA: acetoacetate--CoA ligase, partial [Ktedonobacterales bacterium]|nr:acetoacetate--CoA ligase [Ktedonobacterales bacterium]
MSTPAAAEGTILWQPSEALQQGSVMRDFMRWLAEHKSLHFEDYPALWAWSAANPGPFWEALWQFWDVKASAPYTTPL